MQLGPLPGTKLYRDYDAKGLLRKDIPYEQWHGQHQIWFNHPHFTLEQSEQTLREAFLYDYDQQGSSFFRLLDTTFRGYQKLSRHADPKLRRRASHLLKYAMAYRPGLAILNKYAHNEHVRRLALELDAKFVAEFGPPSIKQQLSTPVALALAALENLRVKTGTAVYQPKTKRTRFRMSIPERIAAWLLEQGLAYYWRKPARLPRGNA